ncbi:CRTAC1 family protein [Shewanella aestuarii]|uniref:CRTAC1 family protein n=1 Tax=Shewanella aestuarii TaxID=1028752 RepID=A0A6G9QLX8_9GAMM|nr:CRTAC1 family protein [Shewanella aestuarii]QIR15123.1 CRTAC1 family protein [Shewanella aestuarii]
MVSFRLSPLFLGTSLLIGCGIFNLHAAEPQLVLDPLPQNDALLKLMGNLESKRDPKCHATATRLEGLIYGTPLTDDARYLKAELQQTLIRQIWVEAAEKSPSLETLSLEQVKPVTDKLFKTVQQDNSWRVITPSSSIDIDKRDQEHYGSIAYSFRAMLAVQQEALLDFDADLPMLSDDAAQYIISQIDLVTLSLLKQADTFARVNNQYQVSKATLSESWKSLFTDSTVQLIAGNERKVGNPTVSKVQSTGLLDKLIDQKITAFEQYNQVNQTLFARNLQVYFAKLALPQNEEQSAEFKRYFTEAMIAFSANFYLQSQAQAQIQQGTVIKEADVAIAMDHLLPHSVNEYEDVIFYPKYPQDKQLVIESYDMDSFRDSGLHWLYLKEALSDLGERVTLEADPFAAELLTEAIAHYGVLLLRTSGEQGKAKNQPELSASLVTSAYEKIHNEINVYHQYQPEPISAPVIVSANNQDNPTIRYFDNVTVQQGVNVEHRSSDWLSRQLRSYLNKDANTGISTIPPAFGGSGVATEDINGDGLVDIFILSGLGNKLYLNRGNGFEDVTVKSGLNNVSQRNAKGSTQMLAGEPRQPLIADWDNDGDQDLMITYVDEPHRIYSNNGDGTFTEVTAKANLGGASKVGGPATTFDFNNDGLLDIYIEYFGNYLKGDLPTLKRRNDNGGVNELYINKGNFVFEKAKDALGADNSGWGQAVTHTDLNMDGWQDLIVGNDFGINAYYINQKGKGFIDYAERLGTAKPSYTMNIGLSDLNQDGIADVYISNIVTMNKDQKYVLPSEDTPAQFNPDKLANMRVVEGNDLFISGFTANGALKYQASGKVGRGYSSTGWAWDADFFDVDNDGDDDLYVLNGMNDYYVYSTNNPYYADPNTGESINAHFPDASKASNVFFLNNAGRLTNASAQSGLDFVGNSRSASYFDLDNDGDLDVIVNNYHDKAQLFENKAETLNNNWLKIRLQGSPKDGVNLDGIGAQVIIGFGEAGYGWRQVSGSQGYMSVHPKEQVFGLGKDKKAKVTVIWPNGKRQFFDEVDANRSYTITYPQ